MGISAVFPRDLLGFWLVHPLQLLRKKPVLVSFCPSIRACPLGCPQTLIRRGCKWQTRPPSAGRSSGKTLPETSCRSLGNLLEHGRSQPRFERVSTWHESSNGI